MSPPADSDAAAVRTKISEPLLNEMIMKLLRNRSQCADARSIMLELNHDADASCNWRIGHFDPGQGDRYTCKATLRRIYESLSHDFEMFDES